MAAVTSLKLAASSVPFAQSTSGQIIGALAMQIEILQAKLIERQKQE